MKIGIVNDLPMATETLRRVVTSDDRHKVVWAAENGRIAINKCAEKVPDLILMDLIMPVMNGVESTRRIMKLSPCPILIVTASVTGNSAMVFEAMGAGALDVVATPIHDRENSTGGQELLQKIERIGRIIGIKDKPVPKTPVKPVKVDTKPHEGNCLVIIGCSTGGPQALLQVLREFPRDFSGSIVVVQHMDQQFTGGLAEWLNSQLELTVRIMKEGDRPAPATVLIPSTNHHVVMHPNKSLGYSEEPKLNFYHPSVDVFFNSVARYWRERCIAAILTGMGRDGAQGMLALHQQGHMTIAQDRQSSVVFGMPKAAIELGAAREILPLDAIGSRIRRMLTLERE
ncbi:MAG: chemotaxis response regulator protein-glutamate methylesterase [Desulfobulbaceae bacterium]|nr:chemotaxis response regulator protein-glutamate methylesterase [Desulfobulbaceae bacterium]